ncbi:MAG TPA: ATP-dependent RNA helicase DbpA [Polyangiaceae bacterium]|nr:ATP-dependent RNA helicase DbpA [Polyangiaceae bacterium]
MSSPLDTRNAETDFTTLALSPALLAVVAEIGFEKLTPVQAQTIPALLAGKDVVGQSRTGSGKTAAFALPILERLSLETRELGALILCPTRELSAQVAREIRRLGRRHAGLTVLVLAGGEPVGRQIGALEKGIHIAVGTPGRVLDHLRRRTLRVHRVATVVLDEADRMLDMGFQEDMEKILRALPTPRQTVFFSATFPTSIEALCQKHQQAPVFVKVEPEPEQAREIRQLVVRAEQEQKIGALRWLLATHPHESALIFANLKVTVAEIAKVLSEAGVSAGSLHGDLEQYDRDRVMAKFRNASTRVLVATDVAARGIDVADLDLVVNFDLPSQPEVYVHRIGRTGRAGKVGLAISLCTAREQLKVDAIENLTGIKLVVTERELVPRGEKKAALAQALERDAKMATLRISGGRKEKVRPGDILGALTGEAGGLNAADIGKIEIHDHFSYVAVRKSISQGAQQSLSAGRIKGRKFNVTFED